MIPKLTDIFKEEVNLKEIKDFLKDLINDKELVKIGTEQMDIDCVNKLQKSLLNIQNYKKPKYLEIKNVPRTAILKLNTKTNELQHHFLYLNQQKIAID